MKPDRTLLLLSASLVIFLLSFFLPLASVHTYCENRTIAAVFGFISIAVFLMFLPNRAASTFKKTVAIIGGALCFLALAVNVAFILYATHLCRHMFDQLHPLKEGHLVCNWSGPMGPSEYKPSWMQTSTEIQGAYLPSMPDFASHSPFGEPSGFWFLPKGYYRNPEYEFRSLNRIAAAGQGAIRPDIDS